MKKKKKKRTEQCEFIGKGGIVFRSLETSLYFIEIPELVSVCNREDCGIKLIASHFS